MLFKRIFDFLLSFFLLFFLSPILLIISFLIYFSYGKPIFYIQIRPGKNSKPFKIVKFRTMLDDNDHNGNLLPDSERITKIGRILRKTSLDELPELFNVLRGEMSLVGPRPLRMRYLERYNTFQNRRHEVMPGITGLAQINGRADLEWNKRFEYDVWYVDNWSFFLDLKILLLTFLVVFRKEGIGIPGKDQNIEFFL